MKAAQKTYIVKWRSPNHSGQVQIQTDDFRGIGLTALKAVWPPPECPAVITMIELEDPGRYLRSVEEVKQ